MEKLYLFLLLVLLLYSLTLAQDGWEWQNLTPQGNQLATVQAIDANTFMAWGQNETQMKTTDFGLTWEIRIPGIWLRGEVGRTVSTISSPIMGMLER